MPHSSCVARKQPLDGRKKEGRTDGMRKHLNTIWPRDVAVTAGWLTIATGGFASLVLPLLQLGGAL